MRIKIKEIEPKAYEAMLALESYMQTTNVTATHKELIKIRASQINGCAFCLNMHSKDARAQGETEQRILLLSTWREAFGIYSEEEQVILAMTEEITLIQNQLSDETYARASALFDDKYLAQLIMAIITINGWNRIAIATHMYPEKD